MAMLPDRDLGIAILWNSESALPSGLLPTVLDRALRISGGQWLNEDGLPDEIRASGGRQSRRMAPSVRLGRRRIAVLTPSLLPPSRNPPGPSTNGKGLQV